MTVRTVAVLAYEDAQVLDVTGPAEVFAAADSLAGGGAYRVVVVSVDGRDVRSFSGMRLGVEQSLTATDDPVDTFVVPGTPRWSDAVEQPELLDAVRSGATRSRRVAAVCAGAFLLGAVGLLDGRRVTTHWMLADDLAARYPLAHVDPDPIFVADGVVHTSAGITAGIDLALAMVEADHGPTLAREVARYLVVFMQRPGGQSQFSVRLRAEPTVAAPLRGLLDAVTADPGGDHRLSTMSARAGFSERHLTRVFGRELGTTPARYVEDMRVEAARSLLEQTDAPLDVVATRSGLGSTETMRRAFIRSVGVPPNAYRQRFRTTGVGQGVGASS